MPFLVRRRGAFVSALLLSFLPFFVPEAIAQTGSPSLVISQIYGEAGCDAPNCSRFHNDFIELFNRSRNPVTISGWSVQYASDTGGEWGVTPLPTLTIQSGKYVLIQGAGNANGQQPLPQPDAVGTFDIALSAGKVALVSNTNPLTGSCPRPQPSIIDFVGFGASTNCFEGEGHAPAPTPSSPALRRRSAGISDQDDNSRDFFTNLPVPRNSATARLFLPGDLLITELRANGPKGDSDDFVEIYNNSDFTFTQGTGSNILLHLIDAPDGCVSVAALVANGTIIPPGGHYLFAGSDYSLSSYAVKDGVPPTTSDSKRAYALKFNNLLVDSVSFGGAVTCAESPEFFAVEGTPLSPLYPTVQYSYVRKMTTSVPQDTQDNASDFAIVTVTGENVQGVKQTVLGAPGPENTTSPVQRNATIKGSLIDPSCSGFGSTMSACARVRTAEGANSANAAFGTLRLRRKFTNKTGANIARLRFRVVDITTKPESGVADLRVVGGTGSFDVTDTNGNTVTIQRLTLEQPPTQPNGGGFNSTVSAGTITLGTPLIANNSINVEFILGVMQNGNFRFFVNVEALPSPVSASAGTKSTLKTDGKKAVGKRLQQ